MAAQARLWVVTAAVGAGLGRVAAALLGAGVAIALGVPDTASGQVAHALAMIGTGALEGVLFAGLTWRAVRHRGATVGRWVGVHAAAFAGTWAVGALASGIEPAQPSTGLLLGIAGATGVLLGALVGLGEARVLAGRTDLFVGAGAAGWAAGMVAGALITQWVPFGPFTLLVLAIELLSGLVTGLVVGLVTEPVVVPRRGQ